MKLKILILLFFVCYTIATHAQQRVSNGWYIDASGGVSLSRNSDIGGVVALGGERIIKQSNSSAKFDLTFGWCGVEVSGCDKLISTMRFEIGGYYGYNILTKSKYMVNINGGVAVVYDYYTRPSTHYISRDSGRTLAIVVAPQFNIPLCTKIGIYVEPNLRYYIDSPTTFSTQIKIGTKFLL